MAGRHIIRRGFAIPPRNRGWTNTSEFAQEAILINDGEEMTPLAIAQTAKKQRPHETDAAYSG